VAMARVRAGCGLDVDVALRAVRAKSCRRVGAMQVLRGVTLSDGRGGWMRLMKFDVLRSRAGGAWLQAGKAVVHEE